MGGHGFLTEDTFPENYVHEFSFYTALCFTFRGLSGKGWRRDTLEQNRVLLAALESSEARVFPRVADVPFLTLPASAHSRHLFPSFSSRPTGYSLCLFPRHRLLVIAVNGNFVVIIRTAWAGRGWPGWKGTVCLPSLETTRESQPRSSCHKSSEFVTLPDWFPACGRFEGRGLTWA